MSSFRTAISAVILSSAVIAPVPGPSAQTSISATPWTELHASRVRLVAGRAKSAKGHYLAGLEIVMADGWKTYWRMPGDSGVPPTFDWAGSANIASTKVLYPAPTRMPEAGGVAIGYKQAVLLPIEITPQDASRPVVLKLALEFGVCREICIPATANFDLPVPAAPAGAPAPEIAAALERVPRPQQSRRKSDPDLKRVAVSGDGQSPKLTIEASFAGSATDADVFIEAPDGLYVPVPKRVATDTAGVVRFETDLGRGLAQDLKGKALTLTLVSEAGATEAQWNFP
jgi:DsbC/DsbD-like thiol-disulfide interchange protein